MKRMLLSFGLAIASVSGFAQYEESFNTGGVFLKGGINYSQFSSTPSANMQNNGGALRVHAGIVADFPIAESFVSFQPGVVINGKGGKVKAFIPGKIDASKNYYEANLNALYVEVPANLVVKIKLGEEMKFIFGGGPYASMGLTGKVKGVRVENGKKIEYKRAIIFNDGNPYMNGIEDTDVFKLNRFEFGLNALIGIETNQYMLTAGYGHGLSRVNMFESNTQDANQNRVFSLSFGYKLGYREY